MTGKVLIANADGSERARVSLAGGPFKTAAVVTGQDGTIFVAGEARRVYAFALPPAWCGAARGFMV